MQHTWLTLTFQREDLSIKELINATVGDSLDVCFFGGCWSLTAKIEQALRGYAYEHEEGYYRIKDVAFLTKLYQILSNEKRLALECAEHSRQLGVICAACEWPNYVKMLESNLKDLEWLLLWIEHRIAMSQMITQLNDSCFNAASRETWMNMCRAWGNYSSDNFDIILWIE